jgi:hypothetical protein
LTAALQGVHPVSLDFVADPAELAVAVVQGEVLVEAAQHHREVLLLLASLPMPVSKQPLAGASEELSATLGAGDPDQGETPCSILPTDVLEAQKLKRLWPLSVFAPFDGCKTPKEQQPSFLLGQFQIELRKSFPQLALPADHWSTSQLLPVDAAGRAPVHHAPRFREEFRRQQVRQRGESHRAIQFGLLRYLTQLR